MRDAPVDDKKIASSELNVIQQEEYETHADDDARMTESDELDKAIGLPVSLPVPIHVEVVPDDNLEITPDNQNLEVLENIFDINGDADNSIRFISGRGASTLNDVCIVHL